MVIFAFRRAAPGAPYRRPQEKRVINTHRNLERCLGIGPQD